MYRLDIGNLGCADDGRNIEVALRQLRWSDADGLVGKAHVQRIAVRLAVDRDGAHPQLLAGADYAQGNLSAIRDQDFLEHDLSFQPSAVSSQLAVSWLELFR